VSIRFAQACVACAAAFLGTGLPATADAPLRVCLQANDSPLSSRDDGVATGFDVALSRAIAEGLGRPLVIQWFTTPDDPDSNPPREDDALLSDGHCELLAGYPLIRDELGRPRAESWTLPPFEGVKPQDRHRWVHLGTLVATEPYRFDAITVVLSPARGGETVRKLSDIAGLRLGVEIHSLADLIAMSYEQGRLADRVVHFPDTRALFAQLESGSIDAGLVDQREFDAWHLAHPATRVTASGYTHTIGFNIGFVGLSSSNALIARVDAILSHLQRTGNLVEIAKANSLTYLPPRSPAVSPGITLGALSGD
jgi:ABC-type amino acid transport substrate-binding protein